MSPRQGQTPSIGQRNQKTGGRALIICCVISLVLLVLGGRGNAFVLGLRGVVQTVTSPARELGSIIASPFVGASNIIANLTTDQQTLSELRAENERLRTRNVELEEAAKDTERLQELLDLRSSYNLQSESSRIISGSSDSWSRSVTIDKGENSGITDNMPVVSSVGVIGQIVDTGPSTATVRLITDEDSSVAAMVQSSRAHGMLRGSVSGELHLDLVSTDLDVEVGDVVITSGLGGVFPKGLPLGMVTAVESADGALYYTITVEPFAHADSLEEVLVVTSLTEEQTATAEDFAEADAQENGTYKGDDESEGDEAATDATTVATVDATTGATVADTTATGMVAGDATAGDAAGADASDAASTEGQGGV